MTTPYITTCACDKQLFFVGKYQYYAFVNIRKESNGEFAFLIFTCISKHAFLGVFHFQQL